MDRGCEARDQEPAASERGQDSHSVHATDGVTTPSNEYDSATQARPLPATSRYNTGDTDAASAESASSRSRGALSATTTAATSSGAAAGSPAGICLPIHLASSSGLGAATGM